MELVVTDRLRSDHAAMKVIGICGRQETGRWLNNGAENSHRPFGRRELAMAKFRSVKSLHKFASIQSSGHNRFNKERHLYNRESVTPNRSAASPEWHHFAV